MITLLVLLLVINAILHALVIYRFGLGDKANMPFLIFTFVNAGLAALVYFAVPYALWLTLVLSAFGLIGLTVTFNKPQHEKTLDKAVWIADAAVVVCAAYLLFLA